MGVEEEKRSESDFSCSALKNWAGKNLQGTKVNENAEQFLFLTCKIWFLVRLNFAQGSDELCGFGASWTPTPASNLPVGGFI